MKNWNDIKYTYHLTGAELLPIIQEGKERTITLKELIDKILSYSKPMENEWGIPPFNPLDKLVYKNKEDIGRLKGAVNKVAEESLLAYVAANKAWDLTTENEELVREALKSAKKAERELVSLKLLEYKVDENYSKILGLEVSIKEEYSSSGQYVIYKFYQGDILLTTVRIPATLVYKGSDYIGIDSFNTIYLLKDKFETDYIEPLREADSRLFTKIQNEIDRATAKDQEIDETLTAQEEAIAKCVKTSDLEGDTYNIEGLFNGVEYDDSSKLIKFKHGDTVVAVLDATEFVKDGFISDVRIEDREEISYLVIVFNTDSGVLDIAIPLTDLIGSVIKVVEDDADLTEPGIYKRKSSNELIFKESDSLTTITSKGLETEITIDDTNVPIKSLKIIKIEDLDTIIDPGIYAVLEYSYNRQIPIPTVTTKNVNLLEVSYVQTRTLNTFLLITQKFKGQVRTGTQIYLGHGGIGEELTWSEWSDPYLDIIEENEEVTAAALNDLNTRIIDISTNYVCYENDTYPSTLNAQNNTVYWGALAASRTTTINLPNLANKTGNISFIFSTESFTGSLVFNGGGNIVQYADGYLIEADKQYEIDALYTPDGGWYLTYIEYV